MEKKFRELNEAHEVLSDPDKRKNTIGTARTGNRPKPTKSSPAKPGANPDEAAQPGFSGGDFGDIFETFFGGRGRGGNATGFAVDGKTWKPMWN